MGATVKVVAGSSIGTAFHMGNGYFYTAAHVTEGYGYVVIENHLITSRSVQVIKADSGSDSALLLVDLSNYPKFPYLEWGNSTKVKIGTEVRAVGYPPGVTSGEGSITAGIVSKNISEEDKIQTDTALNPGNSGGPLFNKCGEVLGIVISGRPDYDGIAYARSEARVRAVLQGLSEGAGVSAERNSIPTPTPTWTSDSFSDRNWMFLTTPVDYYVAIVTGRGTTVSSAGNPVLIARSYCSYGSPDLGWGILKNTRVEVIGVGVSDCDGWSVVESSSKGKAWFPQSNIEILKFNQHDLVPIPTERVTVVNVEGQGTGSTAGGVPLALRYTECSYDSPTLGGHASGDYVLLTALGINDCRGWAVIQFESSEGWINKSKLSIFQTSQ